jgi:SNF2-related domain/Helicase conserved C-terminal domain
MEAEIRATESGLEVLADSAWLERPAVRSALEWAREKELLEPQSDQANARIRIPASELNRLGLGPSSSEPEAGDLWASEHEAVAQLLGIDAEDLLVEAIGHVGGSRLKLRLLINGEPVNVQRSTESPFLCRSESDEPMLVSPLALAIAVDLGHFNAVETHSRADQLAAIARLNQRTQAASDHPEVRARLGIQLDSHLASFTVRRPKRFAAKWIEEGGSRLSLKLYVDGESEPLALSALDPSSPVLDLGGRESVLLSEGAEAIARSARKHQRVRRERVDEAALHSPFSLVDEGTDLEDVELGEYSLDDYSHRILGFEVAKRDTTSPGLSSGTRWYERDDDGQSKFALLGHAPGGGLVQLRFDDSSQALKFADEAEQAVRGGQPSMTFDGKAVRPELQLATRARELARTLAAEDGSESMPSAAETLPKPARLRPVVADVTLAEPERDAPPEDLEARVPWATLDALLEPGIRLKSHQRDGVAWLWHRYTTGASGALLADDMGLGKTIQIASFMLLSKRHSRSAGERRPTLLVAPVVLISNWVDELKRFFVSSAVGRVLELRDAALRERRLSSGELDRGRIAGHDLVIISYETLARYATSLLGIAWDLVILDEAHRIKNQGTSWSIAARGLSGQNGPTRPRKFDFGICSTGTPVENGVQDLWALYDFLSPGQPFSGYQAYCREYLKREDAPRALASRLEVGSPGSSLLRRTKDDLGQELPGKRYETRRVEMTALQQEQEHLITTSAGRKGEVFTILQNLQKLYQHPWLLDDSANQAGRSAPQAIAASPKLGLCLDILREIKARGEKALVFTLWTRMQWLLKQVLESELGLRSVSIINGAPENRSRALAHIEAFSQKPGFDVLVLSPIAAGVGLNITAANHVIHYGRWWNPAKEDQATDRAYRIGQTRPVTVYYPVLHAPSRPDAGFDVKLDGLVAKKRDVARELLEPAGSDVALEELSRIQSAEKL